MNKSASALLFAAVCGLASGGSAAACGDADKDCAKAAQLGHVANRLEFWKPALARPLAERIGPAPAELVEYVRLENIVNDYAERPQVAAVPADFQDDVNAAVAELPDPVKRGLERRLAGIRFMQGVGSTGFTDKVLDSGGNPVAAYVVLDLDALLGRKANEWATWKENTPFKPGDATTLAATIESPGNDNRKNAIQYILLHEFGHVLSVGRNIHPPWWVDDAAFVASEYPFMAMSWRFSAADGRFVSLAESRFPLRRQVAYYTGAKLDTTQLMNVYSQLEATDYPSLYAATNPFDDFAESFASYVHAVLMRKPFELRLARNGQIVKRFESCWEAPRCQAKRKWLELLIDGF
jgi:hypothetical protein